MKGYTLIELMVTLTVAGILLGVGVPSFSQLYKSNKQATANNLLLIRLSLGRSEAIKRGYDVVYCPSDPTVPGNGSQEVCTDSEFAKGYIVFVDQNETRQVDTVPDKDGNEVMETILFAENIPSVVLEAYREDAKVNRFGFDGMGHAIQRVDHYENTKLVIGEKVKCIKPIGQVVPRACDE